MTFSITASIVCHHRSTGSTAPIDNSFFILTDTDGNPILDALGHEIKTQGSNQTLIFPPLTYTIPGTYTYFIMMDDANVTDYWIADSIQPKFITLTIGVDEFGAPTAVQSEEPIFSHTVFSSPAKGHEDSSKLWARIDAPTGQLLPKGQFHFTLRNRQTGATVAIAKNSIPSQAGYYARALFPSLNLKNGKHAFILSNSHAPANWKVDKNTYVVWATVHDGRINWHCPSGTPLFQPRLRK